MLSADAQVVALAIGDDEEGARLGKVACVFQQVDAGPQDGAAAAFDPDALADLGRGDVALVVRRGVGITMRACDAK